jgi:hypothetical protein
MASDTQIANIALSDLGTGKQIANLETEKSTEANVMRQFYDLALDTTERDFPWPFTTKFATLDLVEEDPTSEWKYAYRYPSDCLKLRRILSGVRNDNRQTRVPYKIGHDNQGQLIYTDKADAEIEYTRRVTEASRFPADFTLAFGHRLAAYAAPRICGEDPFKMGPRAMQLYLFEIATAKASSQNEQQDEEEPEAGSIRARD